MDTTARAVLPMLPALLAFAETGQTTAAADVLQIPQSTVSRTLTRLGQELGVDVVERHGRGLRLTAAGETLLPHATEALAAVASGVEEVRAREAGARGTLGLAFQSTLGERVVPTLVKSFLRAFPGTRFELLQTSRPQCLTALADGTVEIALISPLEHRPGLTTLRLHVEPLVLLVPQTHRLATRRRISFAETATESFICMKPGFGMRTHLDSLAAGADFTPTIGVEGNDLSTVRGLVSAGLGVSVTPRDIHGVPGTVEVPIDGPDAVREIGACWNQTPPSSLAQAFQSLLRRRGRRLTEIGLRPLTT